MSFAKSFGGMETETYDRSSYMDARSNPPSYRARRASYLSQIPSYASYAFSQQQEEQHPRSHLYSYEADEEEDIDVLKQQIHEIKKRTLESTENSLSAARQAENSGSSALNRLGEQGEKLHQTRLNMQRAVSRGVEAEHRLKELKIAKRSLFMPHFEINNPFTQSRAEREEQAAVERYRLEREERVRVYLDQRRNQQTVQAGLQAYRDNTWDMRVHVPQRENDWSRGMYSFEADEEDDKIERDISNNLQQLAVASGSLKRLADTIQRVVDSQSDTITAINDKTLEIEDQTARNAWRLNKVGRK
ncbi:Protein transport protein S9 plasma membrane t-SNARE [Orbilia brochopaga]|uniref:Protein transport protein S9 plasma membrane t-SNARE n=1 Tax=Orbilia brochopaga TaxID=3140254 RepID=A0AAV9V7M4_9PEZI